MKLIREFKQAYTEDKDFKKLLNSIFEVSVFGILMIGMIALFFQFLLYMGGK